MKLMILNGPNLNMTGVREVGVYGRTGYEEMMAQVERAAQGIFKDALEQADGLLGIVESQQRGIPLGNVSFVHDLTPFPFSIAAGIATDRMEKSITPFPPATESHMACR